MAKRKSQPRKPAHVTTFGIPGELSERDLLSVLLYEVTRLKTDVHLLTRMFLEGVEETYEKQEKLYFLMEEDRFKDLDNLLRMWASRTQKPQGN